jgi:hypothetical protein
MACAHRALAQIELLAVRAGLPVDQGEVGDPDPIAAILDRVLDRPVDQLLICVPHPHPAVGSLAARAYRATGIPAHTQAVPRAASARRRVGVRNMFKGHCQLEASQAA